jgi:DEAD/DEAH box helicase
VLRLKEAGVHGTKAILLYPMNALANDQLLRLRELIRDSKMGITFSLYTGESETVAPTLGEPLTGHELTRREEIRRNPPDVLLTNYKQLEFLLVRKADRPLFTPALRYVVLDEIHSYRGALATELACLLRRLKARCGVKKGSLRTIGTSATVSQDAGGDAALARFAADLFDELFELRDIIGERYRERAAPRSTYEPPLVELSEAELKFFTQMDEPGLVRLAEKLCGRKAPDSFSTHQKVQALLSGNLFVKALMTAAESPRTLEEIAAALLQKLPVCRDASTETIGRIVEAYLLLGSYGDEKEPPLLRPKLHTFFHGVYDVGLCMNPGCRKLATDGSDSCRHCGSAVRPAVLCRTCGQDFVKIRFDPDHPEQSVPNDDFLSDDDSAFITPHLVGERADTDEESDDNDSEDDEPRPRQRRQTAAEKRLKQQYVDHVRGRVFENEPDGVPKENLSIQHVLRGRGTTCLSATAGTRAATC